MTSISSERVLSSLRAGDLFSGGVHVFDSVGSTNDWALEQIRQGRALPFACIADHQSHGRGRRGRHWLSPAGSNIYLSLAWRFSLEASRLGVFSLAQGGAVVRVLNRIGISDAWLKWPNDVMIAEKKIAGILVETSGVRAGSCSVVAGIGLNYSMPETIIPDEEACWTDVAHAARGGVPDRNELAAILLDEAADLCQRFQASVDEVLTEVESEVEVLKGQAVELRLDDGRKFTGTVLGINGLGELRAEVDGAERIFNSAEVSLRGRAVSKATGKPC
jgi:BirA family biotin operon repressor/biotin-[acetyl-CoA-carboxylase] ligase